MNENLFLFALTVFTGFFAIMNPIANTPVFLGLVGDRDGSERKKIAKTSCLTAFLIVVFFVILGKYTFQLFGITIPAFKITGGLLLFYVGLKCFNRKNQKYTTRKMLNRMMESRSLRLQFLYLQAREQLLQR